METLQVSWRKRRLRDGTRTECEVADEVVRDAGFPDRLTDSDAQLAVVEAVVLVGFVAVGAAVAMIA